MADTRLIVEQMWAGWRSEYIDEVTSKPEGDCIFCSILASGRPDEETHIVWRDELAFAILNAYPYTSGHLMVMPVRHSPGPEDLADDEAGALWRGVTQAVTAVRTAYRPDGLNFGANLGKAAGAGIPGHFHVHVLPRWNGDTNFMTTVAEARVLPETLSRSAQKIRAAWPSPPRISE
jgi:ATP adenylyltransferase